MREVLTALVVGIFIGALLLYLWYKKAQRFSNPSTQQSISYSPQEVESLLFKAGYTIVTKQPKATIITEIDGKEHLGTLEADYLVAKEKRQYVVFIKTSQGTSDPLEPVFRRRLVELQTAFGTEALLLVDPEAGEVEEISFRFPRERRIDGLFRLLIAVFIVAVVIGIIWMLVQLRLF
ncbi:MAG: hypothetical protein QME05_04350 [Candidatus Margulisbacteria bacterium]|nr:hypothetical protein [Candidatus Margulisiibacteriota bacterium]